MLLDRIDERASIEGLLDSARRSETGVVVFQGDAGMGKTVLLDFAAKSAGSLSVVRIVGIEVEQSSSFASLHRLLLPFLDNIDRLPPPQRAALESAFAAQLREFDTFARGDAVPHPLTAEAAAETAVLLEWAYEQRGVRRRVRAPTLPFGGVTRALCTAIGSSARARAPGTSRPAGIHHPRVPENGASRYPVRTQ